MDATIPWAAWVGVIEPHYYADGPGRRGRKAKPVETMLHFRHLLEEHQLGEKLLAAQNEIVEQEGWIMRGGSIVDDTPSRHRRRRRTPPVSGILRCVRRRRATSGTSG